MTLLLHDFLNKTRLVIVKGEFTAAPYLDGSALYVNGNDGVILVAETPEKIAEMEGL
jgi:hypothetical protein